MLRQIRNRWARYNTLKKLGFENAWKLSADKNVLENTCSKMVSKEFFDKREPYISAKT